jgi:prepilin-type N-terminal cleavage/methylation domain-containing protein
MDSKQAIAYKQKKAFTLIEVIISIGLLGIVIVALFSTVNMMKSSNEHLHQYLKKAKKITEASKVLYLDIIGSDGNITIRKDEFTRLCIEETQNSLYALSRAKVCWVVLKKDNTLVRVEGNNYHLPTKLEEQVEVNPVMKHVELFDVYHKKDKVLVFLKQVGKEPITFMIQGITKPVPKKKKPKKKPVKGKTQTPGKPVKGKGQPPVLKPGETPPK